MRKLDKFQMGQCQDCVTHRRDKQKARTAFRSPQQLGLRQQAQGYGRKSDQGCCEFFRNRRHQTERRWMTTIAHLSIKDVTNISFHFFVSNNALTRQK